MAGWWPDGLGISAILLLGRSWRKSSKKKNFTPGKQPLMLIININLKFPLKTQQFPVALQKMARNSYVFQALPLKTTLRWGKVAKPSPFRKERRERRLARCISVDAQFVQLQKIGAGGERWMDGGWMVLCWGSGFLESVDEFLAANLIWLDWICVLTKPANYLWLTN